MRVTSPRPGTRQAEHRVELSATVSETVADAFENAKTLQAEGSSAVAILGPFASGPG